ncbi:hypothetical protein AVEN_145742-1, partial [Araneus ventricosus]
PPLRRRLQHPQEAQEQRPARGHRQPAGPQAGGSARQGQERRGLLRPLRQRSGRPEIVER